MAIFTNIRSSLLSIITLMVLVTSSATTFGLETSKADKPTIKSSVSAEFPQGIHYKYLNYLANELDMNLEITHMTYNRRVISLRNGVIDIMTGIRDTYSENGEFIYLHPSYTSTPNAFFIRNDNEVKLTQKSDLNGKRIAITANDKPYVSALESIGAEVVIVPTFDQKIKLLQRKRIDVFEHVKSSAISLLEQKGLSEQIVLAEYKSPFINTFHFAISTKSPLIERRTEIEEIIAKAVENGVFKKLRAEHYQSK